MTEHDDPVIQRLMFGERARQHREQAGVEFAEADAVLGSYAGKLSKIENGVVAAQPPDIEQMIALYRLGSQDADELRRLGVESRRRSAPERVGGTFRQYVQLERAATEIRMVYNEVPGLLRTKEYALAGLARAVTVAGGEADAIAEARAQRGERIVRPDGAEVWVVLGMDALHRAVGGRDVLLRQLERLREVANMPNVHLRIVSWSSGAVAGLSTPFTLLYVPSPPRTLAYVESLTRADYIKTSGPYVAAFDQAWTIAESDDESGTILDQRISDLSSGANDA